MMLQNIIINSLLIAFPVLFSLTIHELCHGFVADYLGDPTPRSLGRLTINPLSHISWVGLLCLMITRVMGWAKPMPVDPRFFKNPRRDLLWVALAGPMSNAALAFLFSFIMAVLGHWLSLPEMKYLKMILGLMVMVNVGLGLFNLIPVPPLDGGRIVAGLLPSSWAAKWSALEPYGVVILLVIIVSGFLTKVMVPLIEGITKGLLTI